MLRVMLEGAAMVRMLFYYISDAACSGIWSAGQTRLP